MTVSTARAIATLRSLTARFDNGVAAASPFYPELCVMAPSDGADEEYGFLGSMPTVREWIGDRQFAGLRGARFTIRNREWENSLRIDKNDIDDDRLGLYGPVLEQLGAEASHHPDDLLFELVEGGESQACFDGQYFYDTDHAWGDSGTQSNDLSAEMAGSAPTEDEFRAAYHAARKAMLTFKRDNGQLYVRPTIRPLPNLLLLVPTDLEEVANQAINKTLVSNGETNIVLDKPRIVTSGSLTSATKFHLFNLSQPLKPFVFQARRPLMRQMKGLDDREFKDVKFMTDARYNVGYLAWWNAVLTSFS